MQHFPLLEESFVELVNCLSKFSRNGSGAWPAKALGLLRVCARQLRERPAVVDSYVSSQGQALHQRDLETM